MTARPSTPWGLCVDCRFWQIEPNAASTHQTAGICLEHSLRAYQLRVTGNSGCNCFQPGATARAAGSSVKPPMPMQAEGKPHSAPLM